MKLKLIEKSKQGMRSLLSGAAQIVEGAFQLGIPSVGATVSFAVGKWVAGLILSLIALVILFRLLWRRKYANHVKHEKMLPLWAKLTALAGALVASAVLVEMTKLPVRFDQPGFSMLHWVIVSLVILLFNSWFHSLLKAFAKTTSTALIEKP